MALTGIQIFKLLPQTNCKECAASPPVSHLP
jgi:CO dehydrogenase/acetyl-CoA synthase gamma subunit (corrinoid Fe-S protein)